MVELGVRENRGVNTLDIVKICALIVACSKPLTDAVDGVEHSEL